MTPDTSDSGFNVLLSCAGRRTFLADCFRKALGSRGKVFAADMSLTSAAMIEAGEDVIVLPPVKDPRYFDVLLERSVERKVRLIVSLNDFELPGLARQAERFRKAGVIPVISSPEVVDLCFDKWATYRRLTELGIATPLTFIDLEEAKAAVSSGRLGFPLVVKPRWGSASACVEFANDPKELALAYDFVTMKLARHALGAVGDVPIREKILIQRKLTGEEFGVDIINDLDGRHQAVILRRKLAMRAGETDRAVTVAHEGLAALGRRAGESLRSVGVLDCDAFLTPEGPHILELNPRFGGGYPFSQAAGADVPAALIAWARGEKADLKWLTAASGVLGSKCDRLVFKTGGLP